jgi:hypothetical protein
MSSSFKRSAADRLRQCGLLAAAAAGYVLAGSAAAETTFAGTEVVIPLAANISVYHTQVFVQNPNSGAVTLNVRYYQSNNGTPPAGLRPCAQVTLQANQSSFFDVGAQCGLNGLNDDFGMIILEDASPGKTNSFFAYSRTQTPTGLGFSVEGFPTENFSGAAADALGLQNLAAAPNYRSNCFVSSLSDPVNWQLQLVQSGTETVLGSTSGSLAAFQTTRILDVFSSLGLSGDFSNVRARFTTTDVSQPAFVSFCTLETTSNGSADFRIAKSLSPPSPPPTTPTQTWAGAMGTLNANQVAYIFMGSTGPVTLTGASNVTAYGSGTFSRNTAGAVTISVGVCYENQSGPGPVTLMPSPTSASVSNSDVVVFATGSAFLPTATYNVGLCAVNTNNVAINKNGDTTGFVFVTP